MLSDHETTGGAAIAASRLAHGLSAAGAQVHRIVGSASASPHRERTWDLELLDPPPPFRAVRRLLGRRPSAPLIGPVWRRAQGPLLQRLLPSRLRAALDRIRPDVINVHNLHGALGWTTRLAEECASRAPTVWTLHDMWSLTGRCAYSGDCERFLTGCDAACPTPHEYPRLAPRRIAPAYAARAALLRGHHDLVAVAPSRWLSGLARAGLWRASRVETVPYGVPLDRYAPLERAACRRTLGLEASGPVVLVVAADLSQPRKGAALLRDALGKLTTRPLTLLTMGRGEQAIGANAGVSVHSLGQVDDPLLQRSAYGAADLLVHPALEDNLPCVVLESLACGTPVVAFGVGGLPDMVRPGETGWLADEPSSSALAATLESALADVTRADLRQTCRDVAEREYGVSLQASRYLQLFGELLGRASPASPDVSGLAGSHGDQLE
jgi:glycosyltransferase involved in cell wall biosynthesis